MRGKINKVVFILIGLILLVSVIIYFVSSHEREPFAASIEGSIYETADTEMETLSRGDYRYAEPNLGRYDTNLELREGGGSNIHIYDNLAKEPGFNDVEWVDKGNIKSLMGPNSKLNVGDIIHVPVENEYVNVNGLQRPFTPYRILEGNTLKQLPKIEFNPPPEEYTIDGRSEPITDNDINVMNLQTKESLINSGRLTKLESIQNVDPGFVYVDNTRVTGITLTDTPTGGKIITDKLGNLYTITPGNSPRELLSEFSYKSLKSGTTPDSIIAKIAGETRLNVAETDVTLGKVRTSKYGVTNTDGLTETTIRLNNYEFPPDKNSFEPIKHDGPVRSVKLKMADGSEKVIGHIVERRRIYSGSGLKADIGNYFKQSPDFIMDDGIFGPAKMEVEPIYKFGPGGSEQYGSLEPSYGSRIPSSGSQYSHLDGSQGSGYSEPLSQDSGYSEPFARDW